MYLFFFTSKLLEFLSCASFPVVVETGSLCFIGPGNFVSVAGFVQLAPICFLALSFSLGIRVQYQNILP
jgi:hypothetical protein